MMTVNTEAIDRLLAKCTEDASGCWVHRSPRNDGYVNVTIDGRQMYGHRASYEYFRSEIQPSLVLDHLCRNRTCVNPYHLEPVPHRVNNLRGTSMPARNAVKTHCKNGHEFTEKNTYRWKGRTRQCLTCIADRNRAYRASRREVA